MSPIAVLTTILSLALVTTPAFAAKSRSAKRGENPARTVTVHGKKKSKSAHAAETAPDNDPTKNTPSSVINWSQLEDPERELLHRSKIYANGDDLLANESIDMLEGLANEVVLARMIKAIYSDASKKGWTQTQRFRIFSLEHLLSNSAQEIPATFNPHGIRVAVFTLRLGNIQRGVILTSGFQSANPSELRDLYRDYALASLIEREAPNFETFGSSLVERFKNTDSKKSRYMSVVGTADAWIVGCENTVAGRFCTNARLYDARETDPKVFADALQGAQAKTELIDQIRQQNLTWPVDRAFISRGFTACNCRAEHHGLDLTAPIGTPVRAVAAGVIRNMKQYSGWGRAFVIEHTLPSGAKYISLYAHLSRYRRDLKPGMKVERGDLIALTGNSGTSAGPHLHLEIRNAPEGKEPLQQPKSRADFPLDPLRVLDLFNIFLANDDPTTT